jgi:hypothetical protein
MIFSHRRSAPLEAQRQVWGWEPRVFPRKGFPPSRICPPPQGSASPRPKKAAAARLGLRPLFSGLALDPRDKSCCPDPAFSRPEKARVKKAKTSIPLSHGREHTTGRHCRCCLKKFFNEHFNNPENFKRVRAEIF